MPTWWASCFGDKPYAIVDCSAGMEKLPDNCIDFILTDPPYGTADAGKIIKRGNAYESFDIGWDKELPLTYIATLYRLLKDERYGVIFTDNKAVTTIWDALTNAGFHCRQTYHVIKNNPPPNPRHNFMSGVETAVVFSKGNANARWHGGAVTKNYEMVNMIGNDEDVVHPTQKHISTFIHLIEIMSNIGDIVLDPFLGSGTALLASRKTGRVGVGFEINPQYESAIRERSLSDIKSLEEYF